MSFGNFLTAVPEVALKEYLSTEAGQQEAEHTSIVRYTHAFSFIGLDLAGPPDYITLRPSGALPPWRSAKPASFANPEFGGDSRPALEGVLAWRTWRDTGGPIRVRSPIIFTHRMFLR